jgi:hypothetical protein
MYLPIPPQPDCVSAWREAVRLVDSHQGHEAHNVIIDVTTPTARAGWDDPAVAEVDAFLIGHDKKAVETVANTIFPAALYQRYGAPEFFKVFNERVLPKVRRSERWSGYYFERMIQLPQPGADPINQLWDIVERMRNPGVRALNKFELSIFDPSRDVDDSPYGGQCLSFGSFKLLGSGAGRSLGLTVFYRNHFYIEKLLGNLIGLGRLMDFVAREAKVTVGPLTVISTHAQIDQPKGASRSDILALLERCDQATARMTAEAA